MGFGLTREQVEVVISDYLKDHSIPISIYWGCAGQGLPRWQRFLKRWPASLTEREPQLLSKSRAEADDTGIIRTLFDKVEEVLSNVGLDPSDPATAARLWNCD